MCLLLKPLVMTRSQSPGTHPAAGTILLEGLWSRVLTLPNTSYIHGHVGRPTVVFVHRENYDVWNWVGGNIPGKS